MARMDLSVIDEPILSDYGLGWNPFSFAKKAAGKVFRVATAPTRALIRGARWAGREAWKHRRGLAQIALVGAAVGAAATAPIWAPAVGGVLLKGGGLLLRGAKAGGGLVARGARTVGGGVLKAGRAVITGARQGARVPRPTTHPPQEVRTQAQTRPRYRDPLVPYLKGELPRFGRSASIQDYGLGWNPFSLAKSVAGEVWNVATMPFRAVKAVAETPKRIHQQIEETTTKAQGIAENIMDTVGTIAQLAIWTGAGIVAWKLMKPDGPVGAYIWPKPKRR